MSLFGAGLLDLLFPRRCLSCLVFLDHPLSRPRAAPALENFLCPACREQLPPVFVPRIENFSSALDQVFSLYPYTGLLEKLIPAWKYQGRAEFFPLVEILLARVLEIASIRQTKIDLFTSVPLSPRSFRRRGFNQAHFIAAGTARLLAGGRARPLLRKVVETPQQVSLDRIARRQNLQADSFQVCRPAAIAGRRILLCDDVMTTGSTLNAAALALRAGGAVSVSALTLARVVSDRKKVR
ncbi:MAG TPA: ComF family protein [Proteobacteria bacterium]|nr:ComF family protein [Pseudomonadota bacterium]